jgi:hypothetical protein
MDRVCVCMCDYFKEKDQIPQNWGKNSLRPIKAPKSKLGSLFFAPVPRFPNLNVMSPSCNKLDLMQIFAPDRQTDTRPPMHIQSTDGQIF